VPFQIFHVPQGICVPGFRLGPLLYNVRPKEQRILSFGAKAAQKLMVELTLCEQRSEEELLSRDDNLKFGLLPNSFNTTPDFFFTLQNIL